MTLPDCETHEVKKVGRRSQSLACPTLRRS
jgi:hypothetical protein